MVPPDGPARTLLAAEGLRDYAFLHARWSPDGEWVLVLDSVDRLLLLRAAGDPVPRVVATGVDQPAWYVPGHHRGTVPIPSPAGAVPSPTALPPVPVGGPPAA